MEAQINNNPYLQAVKSIYKLKNRILSYSLSFYLYYIINSLLYLIQDDIYATHAFRITPEGIRDSFLQKEELWLIDFKNNKGDNTDILYVNKNYEFADKNHHIQKIYFSNSQIISSTNLNKYINADGIIVYNFESNSYEHIEKYTIEKKILFSELIENQLGKKMFIYTADYFLGNDGYYYHYVPKEVYPIEDSIGFYKTDIIKQGFDFEELIFYRKGGKSSYAISPLKMRIIKEDALTSIPTNNYRLFNHMLSDRFLMGESEYLQSFQELKELTLELTQEFSSKEEKIKAIYTWIVENIDYPENIDEEKQELWSGIHTYKNKIGVCEGQTQLFSIMLVMIGIEEPHTVTGYVFTADDFPQTLHSWVEVGGFYYDPTFENPPSENIDKKMNYYKIPREVFYLNRYDIRDVPDGLLSMDREEREELYIGNIKRVLTKYENSKYYLFKQFEFKKKLGKNINTQLKFEDIEPYIDVFTYKNKTLYDSNGNISKQVDIEYYPLENNESTLIEGLLAKTNYDSSGVFGIKIHLSGGDLKYGIGIKE